jgi:hypothetical protein
MAFNGIKVFSATMAARRLVLGEEVTRWIDEMQQRPGFKIVDIVVRQSSDAAFHCVSFVIFFQEAVAAKKKGSP